MNVSGAKLFVSRRTVLPDGVKPAVLLVKNGKIEEIYPCVDDEEIGDNLARHPSVDREDFGNFVLMPGIVDSHVHVNEPGRSEWEGFWTATKAAAAGGVTTIVDMPLNSIPPTTTLENLKTKARVARTKAFVDVGFWGGVIPGNQKDLGPLVEAGVVGFKCFLHPSGVEEFPHVVEEDLRRALAELQNLNSVLAFHAECELTDAAAVDQSNDDPTIYHTYLRTRPEIMEVRAIQMIVKLCQAYNVRCHVVHLSAAEALGLVAEAKENKLRLSAETCYHYLYLSAERIPRNAPEFKCCPPIRDESNREKLWRALEDSTLDMVVSDHSPCTADLKQTGDFISAWGGISSVQFGLSVLWTEARRRGWHLEKLVKLLCSAPAQLCGLSERKGALKQGLDADFVVWDPETRIQIEEPGILHRNKLTPYLGEKLYGKVFATVVRGNFVYKDGNFSSEPLGQLLLRDHFLSAL